jgi:hypothetical protein
MPRLVEFEIRKSKREVAVFKTEADTVQALPADQRKGNEVEETITTIVRIKPQDIPELIRWARSHFKEWEKRQPKSSRNGREATRLIDDDGDDGEDGDDDAL